MKKRKTVVLLLLTLLASNVNAEELFYKIELVIFAQEMPNTEVFGQRESRIAWPKRVIKRSSYRKVDSEYMNLHGIYAKLRRADNYQRLMHVAWIQGVKENKLSLAVKINNADRTIDGFFRIQRGHLVHMIVDIEYSPFNAGSVIYRLSEKRRFKLNEIHYLDHPKFGVLARISLVSLTQDAEQGSN